MKKKVFISTILFLIAFVNAYSNSIDAKKPFLLISGNSNPELALEIAKKANHHLSDARVAQFNDGESNIQIIESIRGSDVFIIQSTCPTECCSVNDNIMELYLLVRACKRACAGSVTAVIPYFGYGRQDRKTKSREPISASDVAMLIENSGVDHILTVDLHCGQIQGFFQKTPVDELTALSIFVPYVMEKELDHPVIISPDAGAVIKAKKFVNALATRGVSSSLAIIIKHRKEAGSIETVNLVGDVKDRDVVIVDDMCDTGGTLCHAANELKKMGAKRIFVCITHPVFSKNAVEKINASVIDEMIVCNTIPKDNKKYPSKIKTLSIAPLLAEAIMRTHKCDSLSSLFME